MPSEETFRIVELDPRAIRAEAVRLIELIRQATPFGTPTEVGSTAVEGLLGKCDLDFGLGVAKKEFQFARADLDKAFRRDANQLSTECYQGYFLPSEMDATVQLYVNGSHDDPLFGHFLNLLRDDASLRSAYNDLKTQWNGCPMDAYRRAKRKFVEEALSIRE